MLCRIKIKIMSLKKHSKSFLSMIRAFLPKLSRSSEKATSEAILRSGEHSFHWRSVDVLFKSFPKLFGWLQGKNIWLFFRQRKIHQNTFLPEQKTIQSQKAFRSNLTTSVSEETLILINNHSYQKMSIEFPRVLFKTSEFVKKQSEYVYFETVPT